MRENMASMSYQTLLTCFQQRPLMNDSLGLVRDGTEALVEVLAMVTRVGGVDIDETVQ